MPGWGPLTCAIPPGGPVPAPAFCVLFDSGHVGATVIRQTTGTCTVTCQGGHPDAAWAIVIDTYDVNDTRISRDQVVSMRCLNSGSTWSFITPITTNRVVVQFAGSAYQGQTMSCTASGDYSTDVNCAYGSRLKIGADAVVYLTPALLSAWLDAASMPWLAPVFAVFWYTTYSVNQLCSAPPPPMPAIGSDPQSLSIQTLSSILDSIAWFNLCECTPGTPSPTPYPPPTVPAPPGLPSPPTFGCSNVDVCATLIAMQQQLAALQQASAATLELTTLIQRYKAPFAYLEGARHPSFTGEGEIQLPRLVGLMIDVVARSGNEKRVLGNPDYVYDLGWIAIWDRFGLVDEIRLTRDRMVWLSPKQTEATRFAYALRDGVTIAVTELEAEH